jgi:asparagine N-glycosylation enzyme membrane subunit Stt3
MEDKEIKTAEDISKEIKESALKSEQVVSGEIAKKEEKIAKGVSEIPVIRDELEERKQKIISFLKQKKDWAYYLILAFIVFVGTFIRTRNISKLKDITTGTWTLGPDLDPFLFLRWAKDIVEYGSLMVWDMMRCVPLGFNTAAEMKLLSYMIAWFHHFLSFFSKEMTVTYAAIWFPVIMFALTAIAFFLFARKIFYKKSKKIRNTIALIATSFFVLIPSLLPRTIAGIPEKESAAFFFMFMAFYLFLEAFTSKKLKKGLIFGVLAGIATAIMALTWGGVIFIFFTIPTAVLLAFIFGKIKQKELYIYLSWLISSFIIMMPFSTRYSLTNLVMSTSTGGGIGVFVIIGISLLVMNNKKLKEIKKKTKLPEEIFALLISILILFIPILILFGPNFIFDQISGTIQPLITPMTTRFGLTVAENRQPYFASDWKNSFGPVVFNIPLFFWLFFIGSVALFGSMIKKLRKKEKVILIFSYFIFLVCLIFSRYSPSSILNGTSGLSLFIYFGGALFFLGSLGYFYFKNYKEGYSVFKEFDFSYILYFIILTLGIIGARAGIRLIMVLGAVSPIAISFIIVKISQSYLNKKNEEKFFVGIIVLLVLIASLFTLWTYYQQDIYTAENFAPGAYQIQWQKAMAWVRENTSPDAVFAHWWDYGYWLQSIGERATILDGGNTVVYWNYLMGRHVLTGSDEQKALEFLYTHNGTHLLIDSTEIGKYTAYSSIGSDENYDRFSWITTFLMDERQTQETDTETSYIYTGGSVIDKDIIWEEDGKEIFLPKKKAGIGAIILKKKGEKILQPAGIFVYNGQQYEIPLKYAYVGDKLYEFQEGLDAGIFIFPKLDISADGRSSINQIGAAMYLSKRTIHSQLANLYLFDQKSDYFNLAHSEDSLIIENLKQQGVEIKDFMYYQGFQGPIKIWEISYPSDIKANPEYLEITFPNPEVNIATPGEYN